MERPRGKAVAWHSCRHIPNPCAHPSKTSYTLLCPYARPLAVRSSPYTQQGSRASSRPRPRLQSASLRAHSGSFGSSYERQGEEEATSFQLGLDREARAGAALLALGDTFVDFGQSRLRVGDALCVEPGSDIREYTTVLSISFAAAGAGAAARGVAGVMHVEISPALRFTHPAQTVVRKVRAAGCPAQPLLLLAK